MACALRWAARIADTQLFAVEAGRYRLGRNFGEEGARWFHTGGIFCALSETAPLVAREAMEAAHRHGTMISYDLNYRDSLWKSIGGKASAPAK